VSLSERALGRVVATDVKHPITGEVIIKKSSMIDEFGCDKIDSAGIKSLKVFSVMTCSSKEGVCATCYGRDLSRGQMVHVGEAIGMISAQSIGEPGTQLTMRTFHVGGTASVKQDSQIVTKNEGTLKIINSNILEDSKKNLIVMGRNTQLSIEGLLKRLKKNDLAEVDEKYKKRLTSELKIIKDMGFPDYFLVVWDYIKFARDNYIPVGPGRGSAAGSLVAYALRITNIDPVEHGLLFERFLNPARKSMPDIDTDFCIDRRNEVIDYVTNRYGEDKVAQIITFNKMTSKAVLKDVARVLDIPYGEADKLAKLIPVVRGKPYKLNEMIDKNSPSHEFRDKYINDNRVKKWVDLALRIEGTNKTYGVHAAGVVIASDPLDELVPLQRNNEGQIITQYSMDDIESLGLLKMDFLGLKNLTMIEKTISLINQSTGKKINIDDWRK